MLNEDQVKEKINKRAEELFIQQQLLRYQRIDRYFVYLITFEWFVSILIAFTITPRAWVGEHSQMHPHVYMTFFLGGIVSLFPIYLGIFHSGAALTRYVISGAQALWSAIFIHLTGRIETHFHVFVSLAFLSFYRDWKVLIPATIITALDHFIRGIYWPMSVFGTSVISPWRWFEHSCWVLLEDYFLTIACLMGVREMKEISKRTAMLENVNQITEVIVDERTHELQESQKELEKASRAKSEFLANMSHEIRTPLNGIIGMTSLLLEVGKLNPKDQEYLRVIESSGETLMNLINAILDFSKLEAHKIQLENTPFDLIELIKEILISVTPLAEKKGLELIIQHNIEMPTMVNGDSGRLRQVINNLVGNAIKFTSEGHELSQLRVR